MFSGSDDAKDRIRQAIDIVDVVGEHIQLRRQGRLFVGLCPWHDDARPSLQVNPDRQTWKCWVCDVGGDIFSFVMQREGIDFRQALEMLAERAGVALQPQPGRPLAAGQSGRQEHAVPRDGVGQRLVPRLSAAGAPKAEAAREYLAGRGVSAESIERYQLGYAPRDWQWLHPSGGVRRDFARGLAGRRIGGSQRTLGTLVRPFSRPGHVSDLRSPAAADRGGRADPAGVCRRGSGQIHQLAGDTFVFQERAIVRTASGA